jgi:hypothetical protein
MSSRNAAKPATAAHGEPASVEQLGGQLDDAHTPKSVPSQATTARQLGAVLRDLKDETGFSLKELTVLSANNDPFRLDTKNNHRDRLRGIVETIDLVIPGPDPILPAIKRTPSPLVSSEMALLDAIKVLRGRKDYGGGHS